MIVIWPAGPWTISNGYGVASTRGRPSGTQYLRAESVMEPSFKPALFFSKASFPAAVSGSSPPPMSWIVGLYSVAQYLPERSGVFACPYTVTDEVKRALARIKRLIG